MSTCSNHKIGDKDLTSILETNSTKVKRSCIQLNSNFSFKFRIYRLFNLDQRTLLTYCKRHKSFNSASPGDRSRNRNRARSGTARLVRPHGFAFRLDCLHFVVFRFFFVFLFLFRFQRRPGCVA